ncbi:uncharacterized protein STEHIDRAFT_69087, partial [Stereum hirsutum FP-91666 SS1]
SFGLVDSSGRILAKCVGKPPGDPTWDETCARALAAMNSARDRVTSPQRPDEGRRGNFKSLFTGYSYGGGQKYPMPLDMKNATNVEIAEELCANPDIQRIAHYASTAYASAAPKLFRQIDDALIELEGELPDLQRPFPQSVYPTVTFNLGDEVCTDLHHDFLNWIFSWCAIHCLGEHNFRLGGHLILWEWKIVIQFPPGTTILVPSACVAHGNTAIVDGKVRKSFTEYVPGGLLRFHRYKFRTEAQFRTEDPEGWARMKKEGKARFEEGIGMYSTLDSLKEDMKNYLRFVS